MLLALRPSFRIVKYYEKSEDLKIGKAYKLAMMKEIFLGLGLAGLLSCSSSSPEGTCEPACPPGYACSAGTCLTGGKTPQETLQYFTSNLKKGNLEQAVQYFSLHTRLSAREELAQRNLQELAEQLERAPKAEDTGQISGYREIHFKIGEDLYVITFHCSNHGPCQIIQL